MNTILYAVGAGSVSVAGGYKFGPEFGFMLFGILMISASMLRYLNGGE